MKNNSIILIGLIMIAAFSSCDKDDDEVRCEVPELETKSVMLDLEFKVGDEVFAYDTVYELNGVAVEFSDLRFYLSDFDLYNASEDVDGLGTVILADAGVLQSPISLGNTEFTAVEEFHFLLGLNEVVNHEDPTLAEAPLNDASMHWGWDPDSGYKFIKTEMTIDTDDDGTPDTAASIHCATDGLSREMIKSASANENGTITFSSSVDLTDVYSGKDFLNLEGTHGNSALTNGIADRLALELGSE